MRRIAILAAAALTGMAGHAAAQPCQQQAQATWAGYRDAILSGDATAAATLTRFPLTLRGELDDSPSRRIDAAAFKARFAGLLTQDTGLRSGGYSLRQLAADTPSIEALECDANSGAFVIGPLAFARAKGAWKLATIIWEE